MNGLAAIIDRLVCVRKRAPLDIRKCRVHYDTPVCLAATTHGVDGDYVRDDDESITHVRVSQAPSSSRGVASHCTCGQTQTHTHKQVANQRHMCCHSAIPLCDDLAQKMRVLHVCTQAHTNQTRIRRVAALMPSSSGQSTTSQAHPARRLHRSSSSATRVRILPINSIHRQRSSYRDRARHERHARHDLRLIFYIHI